MTAIARRAALGAPAALALAARPAFAARRPLDLTQPEDSLRALVKLRGDLAGARVLQAYTGTLSLLVEGKMPTPVCSYQGLIRTDWTPRPDGAYDYLTFDLGYFGALDTGRHAERILNPLTGEQVEPTEIRDGPIASIYSKHGTFRAGAPLDTTKTLALPWQVAGDDIWYTVDLPFSYANPLPPAQFPDVSSGDTVFQRNRFTYKGRLSELEDDSLTAAPMESIMLATSTIHPWLKMGRMPGFQQILTVSAKIARFEDAPAPIRDFIGDVMPDFVTAAQPFVGAGNSFEKYKRDRLGLKAS
ncbi:MAG: DUF1838 family protein [Rhodospirillaceae bacterium]|nr:DUF1838 family protein [Rhodospirillaceae bacterium]